MHDLYADVRERLGRDLPIDIVMVREASADEIELCDWHRRQAEGEGQPRLTRNPCPGHRIRLAAMANDPDPIEPEQTGTLIGVSQQCGNNAWHQIDVAWDNGRRLMLVWPPDEFEIVDSGKTSIS